MTGCNRMDRFTEFTLQNTSGHSAQIACLGTAMV